MKNTLVEARRNAVTGRSARTLAVALALACALAAPQALGADKDNDAPAWDANDYTVVSVCWRECFGQYLEYAGQGTKARWPPTS